MVKEMKRFPNYYVSTDGNIYHGKHQLSPVKVRRGYLTVDIHGKRYMIHRLVAEEFIKDFSFEKQVHHKDGDVSNNKVNNLQCVSQIEHMRMHRLKNPIKKICVFCGKEFEPDPTKRAVAKFCNRECYKKWMRTK